MKPKPGGLFDTGTTGVSKVKHVPRLTSVDLEDEAFNMYATAFQEHSDANTTEDNGLSYGAIPLLRTMSGVSDLLSLDGDLNFSENTEFCEVFTDLSQILQDENQDDLITTLMETPVPPPTSEEPTCRAERRQVKRTASQASLEAVDAIPTTNPDHCDYTAKHIKRKRGLMRPDSLELDGTDSFSSVSSSLCNDNKYAERRRKNNIASRRSRETRKQKHSSLEQKAVELEKENQALRLKVDQLEKLAKEMKDILVDKLSNGK